MQELCSSKDAAAAKEEQLISELATVSILLSHFATVFWILFVHLVPKENNTHKIDV